MLGQDHMYFYDAAAPIIEASSIDMNIAYRKSHGKYKLQLGSRLTALEQCQCKPPHQTHIRHNCRR